jgi:ubiquitin C-terminal hydrolase
MPFFKDQRQLDAFEFLVQLLDLIQTDVRDIARLFYGKIVAMRRFRCGTRLELDGQRAFWTLPLPRSRGPLDLADCVGEWGRIAPVDEATRSFCPCHSRAESFTTQMLVERFAQYIVIQLDRFYKVGGGSKDGRPVNYPFQFRSADFAAEDTGTYSLVAVVCHQGREYAGRYTCIVGNPGQATWYAISDETVTPVQRETAIHDDAYILFYERQNPDRGLLLRPE